MSIANELSTDVATAVLAGNEEKGDASPKELIDLVVKVHSTLRDLTTEARKRRRSPIRSLNKITEKYLQSNTNRPN